MRILFADASYFIALLNNRDSLHRVAAELTFAARTATQLTTPLVLTEVLDAFCSNGPSMRTAAANLAHELMLAGDQRVVDLTPDLLTEGLTLYRARADKSWSFTDCVSFTVMRRAGTVEALTFDRHFIQAGFRALLREA
jgi:predicted nucleic acid-binding protein